MKPTKIYLLVLITCLNFPGASQSIQEINTRLGRGINYGNMFEAPSETEWGNPWQPEYPEIIASLGFNHVRIPIRWEPEARSADSPPYTIDADFLARIKEIVDTSLENKLMAIINMHHHEALYEDPDGQNDRFLAQWEQISSYFKDYSDSLVFEILNEPHGNLTPVIWNQKVQDALDVIRVDNPTRAVLIGTAEYGGLGGLSQLVLPEDDHIIVTIHYYNPFQFTHQGAAWVGDEANDWLGTEWLDTETEREVIQGEFAALIAFSAENDVPVHIGEFGAYSTADIASRSRWTTYLGRYFESLGWSWAYWEFSAGFGIFDPATEMYVDELVDALLVNEMPDPLSYEKTILYESDFTEDLDGWFMVLGGGSGADATLSRIDNNLTVTIDALGSENWHIQLVRTGLPLEEGKKYRFSFTGFAADSRSLDFYIGRNSDPWTQYGVISVTAGSESASFSGTLDMLMNDPQARIVFDLGSSMADFTISSVSVESLLLPGEEEEEEELLGQEGEEVFNVYPNPTPGHFIFSNRKQYDRLMVSDILGRTIQNIQLENGDNIIDLSRIPPGTYFLSIFGIEETQTLRLIRQ